MHPAVSNPEALIINTQESTSYRSHRRNHVQAPSFIVWFSSHWFRKHFWRKGHTFEIKNLHP